MSSKTFSNYFFPRGKNRTGAISNTFSVLPLLKYCLKKEKYRAYYKKKTKYANVIIMVGKIKWKIIFKIFHKLNLREAGGGCYVREKDLFLHIEKTR